MTFLRPLDEFPDKRVRLMMEMHVMAPLHLTQLAIPAMRERGRGWVLNVTSVGGDLPDGPPFSEFDTSAGFGVYGTVKAALNRLTKSLAAELYDDGIAVNAAAPSNPVATEGAGALDLAKTDTEDIALITQTAFVLCTGDPKTLTGRIAHTQPFLRESRLAVRVQPAAYLRTTLPLDLSRWSRSTAAATTRSGCPTTWSASGPTRSGRRSSPTWQRSRRRRTATSTAWRSPPRRPC